MTEAEAAELCRALIFAEFESEVIQLLKDAMYWDDPTCWRYYGDNELNWSQAGGQQGRADYALNEKVINSIDSLLMTAPARRDQPRAPMRRRLRAAVAKFIETGAPQLKTTGAASRTGRTTFGARLRRTSPFLRPNPPKVTGRVKPCINIADRGEGHTPEAFPVTFVSLGKSETRSVSSSSRANSVRRQRRDPPLR